VRSGESVYILAQLYGSSVDAIAEANGLNSNYLIHVNQVLIVPVKLPNPATSTPTPTPVVVVTATPDQGSNVTIPPTTNETYVVQRGDTLSRIAQRFNTNVATLAQINGIVNIDRIQAGQRLILPGAPADPNPPTVTPRPPSTQIYVVLPGDTLSRISLRFGVPMSRIAQANNIANWNRIFYGQRLIIPS
jgi:LysM repeat protein